MWTQKKKKITVYPVLGEAKSPSVTLALQRRDGQRYEKMKTHQSKLALQFAMIKQFKKMVISKLVKEKFEKSTQFYSRGSRNRELNEFD